MYKRFSTLLIALFVITLGTALVGCDSTDDDSRTETELFVGSWTGVSAIGQIPGVGQGDFFTVLGASLDADFKADGTFTWLLSFSDPNREDVPLGGTYTVNETANVITVGGTLFPQGVPMQYSYANDNQVTLTFPAAVLGAVLQQQLEGDVALTLARD